MGSLLSALLSTRLSVCALGCASGWPGCAWDRSSAEGAGAACGSLCLKCCLMSLSEALEMVRRLWVIPQLPPCLSSDAVG